MERLGTVSLLGAGASADAHYPTADAFLEEFKTAVETAALREREMGKRVAEHRRTATPNKPGVSAIRIDADAPPVPDIGEWFAQMWQRFAEAAAKLRPLGVPELRSDGRPHLPTPALPGPGGSWLFPPYAAPFEAEQPNPPGTPYLETFFAFYDEYMRPIIAAVEGDPGRLRLAQHHFRELRSIGLRTAYRLLTCHGKATVSYLTPLFELAGPLGHPFSIATLNFDVSLEHAAVGLGVDFADGFDIAPNSRLRPPPEWPALEFKSLQRLWNAVASNCHPYVGLKEAPSGAGLILKLHGSIGWYVVEEGSGDVGSRDELRHNTAYGYFRLPYDALWSPETKGLYEDLAVGGPGDLVVQAKPESPSRKAGAVWVRPYLGFARALKTHPDRVSLDLISTFVDALHRAAWVLVVGYSWSDPHVNDLILDAVAQGANLVNISRSAKPSHLLGLLMQRFPTTFPLIQKRLFLFGGGALRVLQDGNVDLPSGASASVDIRAMDRGDIYKLSLAETLTS